MGRVTNTVEDKPPYRWNLVLRYRIDQEFGIIENLETATLEANAKWYNNTTFVIIESLSHETNPQISSLQRLLPPESRDAP